MRGPRGKGCAEMAVARVASCGFETPMSENGFEFTDRMDSEFSNNQRRMSDTNLFNRLLFGNKQRGAVTPGPSMLSSSLATPCTGTLPGPRSRRWQSDSDNFAQDSDFDSRSTTGEPMSTSTGSTWSVRGALHWLKEKKEESPLNAYLTYVTLPWASILEGRNYFPDYNNLVIPDLLSTSQRRPILTFDLDYIDRR